jgi:hypothetical protein
MLPLLVKILTTPSAVRGTSQQEAAAKKPPEKA